MPGLLKGLEIRAPESKESIPPAYVAWRAFKITLFFVLAWQRQYLKTFKEPNNRVACFVAWRAAGRYDNFIPTRSIVQKFQNRAENLKVLSSEMDWVEIRLIR